MTFAAWKRTAHISHNDKEKIHGFTQLHQQRQFQGGRDRRYGRRRTSLLHDVGHTRADARDDDDRIDPARYRSRRESASSSLGTEAQLVWPHFCAAFAWPR